MAGLLPENEVGSPWPGEFPLPISNEYCIFPLITWHPKQLQPQSLQPISVMRFQTETF
jgi:hypothetical protein